MKGKIDFEFMHELFRRFEREENPRTREKIRGEIQSKVSPYDFLMWCVERSRYEASNIFRKIFSLTDLLKAIEEMQRNGEDIRNFVDSPLVIDSAEDVKAISDFCNKPMIATSSSNGEKAKSEENETMLTLPIVFSGGNLFKYGNVRNIRKRFSNIDVRELTIEQAEEILKSKKDCKGIPVILKIENIGQLPLDKLSKIEKRFDVVAVRIKQDRAETARQGETRPLTLQTYKEIRNVADEIISNLYVRENIRKEFNDLELSMQVMDQIARRMEYDYDATKMPKNLAQMQNASSLVGLLTGKSICAGYSEILRNVLSCVGVKAITVVGSSTSANDMDHAWNQIRIGDDWYNVDITYGLEILRKENLEPIGSLFMEDSAFYGPKRRIVMQKGKPPVVIGGHYVEERYKENGMVNICSKGFLPQQTAEAIKMTRGFQEKYEQGKGNKDYKGPVPYRGSSVEAERTRYQENEQITR